VEGTDAGSRRRVGRPWWPQLHARDGVGFGVEAHRWGMAEGDWTQGAGAVAGAPCEGGRRMGASAAGGASCIEVVRRAGGVVAAAVASAGGIGGSPGWLDGLAGPAQHEKTKSLIGRIKLVS
jgi:hypothetical protein